MSKDFAWILILITRIRKFFSVCNAKSPSEGPLRNSFAYFPSYLTPYEIKMINLHIKSANLM